jgi:hypothetical protein
MLHFYYYLLGTYNKGDTIIDDEMRGTCTYILA